MKFAAFYVIGFLTLGLAFCAVDSTDNVLSTTPVGEFGPQPLPSNGTTPKPTPTPTNVTTTAAPPTNQTTTITPPTTPAPTPITTNTTTTTSKPPTTSPITTPVTTNGTTPTTSKPSSTSSAPPTPKPGRKFDLPSFIGGFVLAAGLMAIGVISWKFYLSRQENYYHTL